MKSADGKEVGNPILPVKFINVTVQIILLPKETADRIPASSGSAIAFNCSERAPPDPVQAVAIIHVPSRQSPYIPPRR